MMTKKILSITTMLFVFQYVSFAQVQGGIKLGYGITGANFKNNVSDFTSNKGIASTNIGLFGDININRNLSFQPEISYTQRGFSTHITRDLELYNIPISVGASVETKVNYFHLPLHFKYSFTPDKTYGLFVLGGPFVSYAQSGKLITKAKLLIEIPVYRQDLNLNQINRLDYGISGGVGGFVKINQSKISLEAIYGQGLANAMEGNLVDLDTRSQTFMVNLGYGMQF